MPQATPIENNVIFFCLSYLGVNVTYLGSGPMNTLSLYPPSDLGEADS